MAEKQERIRLIRFSSSGRSYCIDLLSVKEVLRAVEWNTVDELPSFVRGVINVRGEWVPVIDFAARAGGQPLTLSIHHRFALMRIQDVTVALLVEKIEDVIDVDPTSVSKNIQDDVVLDRKYIKGTVNYRNTALIWVDITRLLTSREYAELEKNMSHVKRTG